MTLLRYFLYTNFRVRKTQRLHGGVAHSLFWHDKPSDNHLFDVFRAAYWPLIREKVQFYVRAHLFDPGDSIDIHFGDRNGLRQRHTAHLRYPNLLYCLTAFFSTLRGQGNGRSAVGAIQKTAGPTFSRGRYRYATAHGFQAVNGVGH